MTFQGNNDVRVQGSSISLAPTGVVAGTYNSVTVDINGRVTVGGGSGGTPVSGTVTVALSGDASGSGSGSGASPTITVPVTLDTVNANVGTFQGLTVNAKGLVTAAVNQGYLTGNQTITLSGDASGSGTTSIPVTLDTVNANVGTFQGLTVNAKGLVTAAVNQTYFNVAGSGLLSSGNTVSVHAGQVPGTTTNDNASAGNVGEFVSASVAAGSAIALTNATAADITSISLTAGDWDVEGLLGLREVGGPTITVIDGWVNSTSVTAPNLANSGARTTWSFSLSPTADIRISLGRTRFSLSATTTIYLSTNCTFSGGTSLSGYGRIEARRVR